MKTKQTFPARTEGNVLLLAIVTMGLISFLLVAYLTLVKSQNASVARSQTWNAAMPVVEAGLEDALAHLNAHGTTNLNCDGWSYNAVTLSYSMTRSIGQDFYTVIISNFASGTPIIESRGYVQAPSILASAPCGSDAPLLADAGASPTISFIGRGVRVNTTRSSLFIKGMVAKDSIDLNGNNITTDSFDSANPLYSTNGLYNSGKRRANGDVAVNSSLVNSLDIGNANIYGHIATGPNGSVSIGSQGVVGDEQWHANHTGVQDGYLRNDMNVSFPDVKVPFTGGFTPGPGDITNVTVNIATNGGTTFTSVSYPFTTEPVLTNYPVTSTTYPNGSPGPVTTSVTTNTSANSSQTQPTMGTYLGTVTSNYVSSGPSSGRGWWFNYNAITSRTTNYTYPTFTYTSGSTYTTNTTTSVTHYDYVLEAGDDYQISDLNGSIYVKGSARLYVSSGLSLNGVTIKPGGHLDLYCGAASVSLSGNNTANSSGVASAFQFWGLSTCTSISLSGNAAFVGTIYAPYADFRLNGGGNNTYDFVGASISKSVQMNGHFNFHYDEALGRLGGNGSFVISSWSEMSPQEIPRITQVQ